MGVFIIIIFLKLLLNHLGKYYHGNHFFCRRGWKVFSLLGPFWPLPSFHSSLFSFSLLPFHSPLSAPVSYLLLPLLSPAVPLFPPLSVSPSSILPISDSPFSLSLSLNALTLSLPSGESRNFQLNNFNSHKLQD